MIYCVDIDGTICTKEVDPAKAQPFKERIEQINKLYDEGHTIYYDTARGNVTHRKWHDITAQQLKDWGAKYHLLRCGKKIHADVYIDDKSISDKEYFNDSRG